MRPEAREREPDPPMPVVFPGQRRDAAGPGSARGGRPDRHADDLEHRPVHDHDAADRGLTDHRCGGRGRVALRGGPQAGDDGSRDDRDRPLRRVWRRVGAHCHSVQVRACEPGRVAAVCRSVRIGGHRERSTVVRDDLDRRGHEGPLDTAQTPPVSHASADADGFWLAREYAPVPGADSRRRRERYDLQGNLVASVELPPGVAPLAAVRQTLFGSRVDSLTVPELQRYDVVLSGSDRRGRTLK